jgi:tetratricopeptide (TPR) repeat protein
MAGRRFALLVATYDYKDQGLRQLVAPAHDAEQFAEVLRNAEIAGFDVRLLINEPLAVVGEAVGDFYRDRRRDDLTLLYFTGHGLKDDYGRLYLAMTNTRRENLQFTALAGQLVSDAMRDCMARQNVLMLDCCYSGAFPDGSPAAKGDPAVHTMETFGGRGRAVLTASDATQYSFEGAALTGSGAQSVFTGFVVEGLRTGEADLDGDGDVSLDELYRYVHDRVVETRPQQRPKMQEDVEGRITIARNVNWALPNHIVNALASPIPDERLVALDELRRLHRIGNAQVQVRVIEHVRMLAEDDSRKVSEAARAFQSEVAKSPDRQAAAEPRRSQGSGVDVGRQQPAQGAPGHAAAGSAAVSYEAGRTAEAAGDWAAAIKAYAAALADPQRRADAASRLRTCRVRQRIARLTGELRRYAQAGQWQDVVGVSAEIARLEPDEADPDQLTTQAREQLAQGPAGAPSFEPRMAVAVARRGQNYLMSGREEDAVEDLTRAIGLDPTLSWAIAGRGDAYRTLGRYDEAIADYDRALELNPHLTSAIADRGEARRLMGSYDESIADFTRALEIEPDNAWAIGSRGQAYRSLNRYDEAIADLTRAIELDPSLSWTISARGETYRTMGRYYEAIADFTRAIDLAPENAGALADRGEAYRLMGRNEEAVADFTRAIELAPDYAFAIGSRGQSYRALDRYDEALADLNRSIELAPDASWAVSDRGEVYRLMGRYEEAVADFTRALELNPTSSWVTAHRGDAYRLMGRYEEAMADFTRAIDLDPEYAWAFASRGDTQRLLDHYDESLADLSRAIDLDPDYTWALAGRGSTYQLMGRYDEAVADFTRALGLEPESPVVIASRGEAYRMLGRYDEALADLGRAIDLQPDYAFAIASRGTTHRMLGRYDEALADLGRAIDLDPNYAWAIAHRGEAYRLLERYDEAIADFTRAIDLDPNYAWAIGSRGQANRELGRYEEALTDLTRAIGLSPDSAWVFADRGEVYRLMGRYDEAVADLTRAVDLEPEIAWPIASRGRAYRALGRNDEALADLTRAFELDPRDDTLTEWRELRNQVSGEGLSRARAQPGRRPRHRGQLPEGGLARQVLHAAVRGEHQPVGRHVPQRPAHPAGHRLRRLHRRVAQVQHAQDDGLAVQLGQHRAVKARLRGLDRHLVAGAAGQLGQERVAGRAVVHEGGVPEAQVDRGGPGRLRQRPVDRPDAVAPRPVRVGLQVRLVELDDVRPGREQVPDLLADRLGVGHGERLGAAVEVVLRLQRHRERPGHGDLDGPVGVRAQEPQVVHLDRAPPPDRPGDPGHRVRLAAAAEHGARVVDVHPVQRGREPVGVALPADLAVGDDVEPGPLLVPDRQHGRVALRLLQVPGVDPPQLPGPHPRREPAREPLPVDQPVRLRVASDQRRGKQHGSTVRAGSDRDTTAVLDKKINFSERTVVSLPGHPHPLTRAGRSVTISPRRPGHPGSPRRPGYSGSPGSPRRPGEFGSPHNPRSPRRPGHPGSPRNPRNRKDPT